MANKHPAASWKPGQSGNPNGRPKKGEAVTDILRDTVDKQALVNKLVELAMEKGDFAALRYAIDRLDGKPIETINQTLRELPPMFEIDLTERDEDNADTVDVAAMEEQQEIQDS